MSDETTNESNDKGKENPSDIPKPDEPTEESKEPTTLYDKTEKIVTRQEEANKKTEELLKRQETLFANQRLAGTTGGKVEPTTPSKLTDTEYADKFMKGEVNPMKEDDSSINT